MPRNVYIDRVQEQVLVPRPAGNHSLSEDTEGSVTVIRSTTVLKHGKKKRTRFQKALHRFAKKTGLKKLKKPIRRLWKRFKTFAYGERELTVSSARVRHTSLLHKIGQYLQHGLTMLWLTLYAFLRLLLPVVTPLCGLAILGFSVWWLTHYSVALSVTVNAETLGYVESSEQYDRITARVAETVVNRTGEEYTLDSPSTLNFAIIPKDGYTDEETVYTSLQAIVDQYIGQYYGFFLDGKMIAAARTEYVFTRLENELLSYYLTGEDHETYEIVNDIDILRDSYAKNYIMDYDDLLELFTEPTSDLTHTVKKGETLESIAEKFNTEIPLLKLVNGDPDLTISVGDELRVGKPELTLTVQTVRTVSYNEIIPYETKYIKTDDLYEGQTRVKNKGSNGSYSVTAEIRSVNGVEIGRSEVSKTKTKDAISQQILVGIKEIVPSGSFIFPLDSSGFYKITSNFGWRTLRGVSDFHRGLDLAANYGTAIYAVDAGTVVEKGNAPSGLGNYVKIDHGNGIITVYGHASSIAKGVKVGAKVYQGQTIAYVGSTGNSTGNHLHLGVYNKETDDYMDPLPYLKNLIP